MTGNSKKNDVFNLRQIAGWQIPALLESDGISAALPALQRGAVWKPNQAELLWDSILRGFPIGAVMLAPYDPSKGNKSAKENNGGGIQTPDFHLLDGQQRCNAVALGWADHWQSSTKIAPSALWLDMHPPEVNDEQDLVFRVVTNSHPWGYQRNSIIRAKRTGVKSIIGCEFSNGYAINKGE